MNNLNTSAIPKLEWLAMLLQLLEKIKKLEADQ